MPTEKKFDGKLQAGFSACGSPGNTGCYEMLFIVCRIAPHHNENMALST
jgi:hypothetical protein